MCIFSGQQSKDGGRGAVKKSSKKRLCSSHTLRHSSSASSVAAHTLCVQVQRQGSGRPASQRPTQQLPGPRCGAASPPSTPRTSSPIRLLPSSSSATSRWRGRWRSAARSRCCRSGAPRRAPTPHAPRPHAPTPHATQALLPHPQCLASPFSPPSSRSCDEHPELPPTVEWQGLPLHATCANLWANCVRATPPTK